MKQSFHEFFKGLPVPKPLSEEKREVEEVNLHKLGPYDAAHLCLKAAICRGYDEMVKQKGHHEAWKADDDFEPFPFTPDTMMDHIEEFFKDLKRRIDEMSDQTKLGAINELFPDVKKPKE